MRLIGILVAFIGFLSASPALAVSCSFSMTDLNFGWVNLTGGGSVQTTGNLRVTCSNPLVGSNLSVRICSNINAGSGGQVSGTRQMKFGNAALNFELHQDGLRTSKWGSVMQTGLGSPMAIDMPLPLEPLLGTVTVPIYGRISSSQGSAVKGQYNSSFAGTETRFNYAAFSGSAPNCATMTENPTFVPFNVAATVEPTCIVSAQTLNFGIHNNLLTAVNATGTISLTCTSNLPYTVSLNGGLSNSPAASRKMVRPNGSITYGLYTDAARTIPWGSAAGQTISGTGNGSARSLTVYGRVPAQTTPMTGLYSDTVVVTVNY
ncbi:spore coat protein U domain-containing protein [Agrobacterium rubi]|nr:spore coat protein U domain-containing protein [Agrobacterium rubi]NTF09648.1 spore coat protein U domain-containing protein [Agrobacterium rubi]NTF22555.1 spore coat protein U domain-containing protein [Agrobacterium rubi]NTF29412.1 spore coat protein U domain-containing protein [Agrobacterium rubi]